jgi:hypothetical protein
MHSANCPDSAVDGVSKRSSHERSDMRGRCDPPSIALRFLPPPRLKRLVPRILHDFEPFRGNAGEFGDCVAAGLVVNEQAVADQAQRLHGMRGVPEGLLDVEQKRDQA